MSRINTQLAQLTPQELDFIVTTVTTRRTDYKHIKEIVKDKPDFLEVMLDDERLFQRIVSEEEVLLRISPYLFFTIVLRKAKRDLASSTFTMEPITADQSVPVFNAAEAARLIEDSEVRNYLAEMLSSFTRTNTITMRYKKGGVIYRRTFSDSNVDDMLNLLSFIGEESKFTVYKRIGDICLFSTGLFPEHVLSFRPAGEGFSRKRARSFDDYEKEGIESYQRAAREETAEIVGLRDVLEAISERFALARKALNLIAERYIPTKRKDLFEFSCGS